MTNYSMYITLKVAAPEIDGKWDMCQIPGAVQADGTVNNTQTSTGTGCSILKNSSNKEKAWELLKWWTSADTQYTYSENVETILGVSGRIATANVEALQRMSWDGNSKTEIMEQWNKINDIPEIPGGYYVPESNNSGILECSFKRSGRKRHSFKMERYCEGGNNP